MKWIPVAILAVVILALIVANIQIVQQSRAYVVERLGAFRAVWGVGLHVPYDTGRSGFYNIPSFKDGQSLHLAVGYPF